MYRRVPFGSFGQGKIVGGVPEPDPAIVRLSSVQQNAIGAFLQNGRPLCTGTLVSPRVVLSAAHCSAIAPGTVFAVGHDLARPAVTATVLAVFPHPGFRRDTADSDFLLAYLDRDMPATMAFGGPPSVEDTVQTVGYGRTGADVVGNMLRWWLAEPVREVRANDFVVYGTGAHGMCLGDSGGPAIMAIHGVPTVVGTVSWGEQDCTGTDVFKRVDTAADWIRATIAGWEESPPHPSGIRKAGVGWILGFLLVGLAVGLAVRSGARGGS